ncbi:MAG: hypothetical protein ACRBG0_18775 [Lewinella sp.]|uniref:hypothetical protein n=1 Tax=Lewinella sp. TaxID=2004506 RepID=UPI003D6B1C6F
MKSLLLNTKVAPLLFYLFFILAFTLQAQQEFVCGNELDPQTTPQGFSPTEDCFTSVAPAIIEQYKPDLNTPVKQIRVKLWVMEKALNDPQNFSDTPQDRAYFQGLIDIVNNLLTDIRPPLLGSPVSVGYPGDPSGLSHIADSRIQLAYDPATDIEFVIDSDGWNNGGFYNSPYLSDTYVDNKDCVFDIFFIKNFTVSGFGPSHYNIHYGFWNDVQALGPNQPITDIQYRHAYNLLHELGHTLNLGHSWIESEFIRFPDLQCPHCANGNSACAASCPTPWCRPDQDANCYNNVMSYAKEAKRNFTPLQIARMHQMLLRGSHTQYLVHELDHNQDIIINGQQTWDIARLVEGDITIPSGAELTISCKVLMAPNSSIFVKKGGRLNIDNGHITVTSPSCGRYWEGIIVEGNPAASQSGTQQGWLVLENDALVEYARTGASIQGGGVIRMTDSEIKDCRYGVAFFPYQHPIPILHWINSSTFENSTFSITNDHNDGVETFNSLNGVSGIEYINCQFLDQRTPTTTFPSHFGYFQSRGIQSFNSHFEVTGNQTLFSNLWLGVEAGNSSSIRNFVVEEATFTNCFGGIVNRAVNFAVMRGNTFEIGGYETTPVFYNNTPPGTTAWNGFGISMQSATDFKLSKNNFKALPLNQQGDMPTTLGVFVNDLGAGDHRIQNNVFENLTYSNYALGANTYTNFSPTAPGGLQYLCNTNSGSLVADFYDFYVADQSRIAISQGYSSRPAGNTFRTSGQTSGYSFRNAPPAIRYYSYQSNSSEYPVSVVNVNRFTTQFLNSCELDDDGFTSETDKETYANNFENSRGQFLQFLGGGGTFNPSSTQQGDAITQAYGDFQSQGQRLVRAAMRTGENVSETEVISYFNDLGGRTANYGVADWHFENDNFTTAQAIINGYTPDLSDTHLQNEYAGILSIKQIQTAAASLGRDWNNLLPNEVINIALLADNGKGIPRTQSRQVLNQFYGYHYLHLPPFAGASTQALIQDDDDFWQVNPAMDIAVKTTTIEGLESKTSLNISPNPASGRVQFDIEWTDKAVTYVDLLVVDLNGREIYNKRLVPGQSTTQWYPDNLEGVYYVYLRAPGLLKHPQKLLLFR